jgi:hypothetical protein
MCSAEVVNSFALITSNSLAVKLGYSLLSNRNNKLPFLPHREFLRRRYETSIGAKGPS